MNTRWRFGEAGKKSPRGLATAIVRLHLAVDTRQIHPPNQKPPEGGSVSIA